VIPYSRQDISETDIDAVVGVLKSDFLTQGPVVPSFEVATAQKVNATHAVAFNSATSALHVACMALGLKKGDWLWTSPNTFAASANCALYCGANVDFVDIDAKTYNICVLELEKKLIVAEKEGRLPKIVIPVHFAGQSCDMKAIHALSNKYHFKIIEDASHAIGGKYDNQYIGGCQFSDITVFSFHPVKIITTGEGGMALTNDKDLVSKMRLLRSHGITRDTCDMSKVSDGPWYYEQIDLGFNYRMNDIQAALGLSQLSRLDMFVKKRNELALLYKEKLKDSFISYQEPIEQVYSAYHLFVVQINEGTGGELKRELFKRLGSAGIKTNVHYIPVHLHPYYLKLGFKVGDFPRAEKYYKSALTLPLYPELDHASICSIVDIVKTQLGKV
jgi:UDP-4-amino-4,6-dideoxy-N-acetyl-beta-L-altrosamine transaminase